MKRRNRVDFVISSASSKCRATRCCLPVRSKTLYECPFFRVRHAIVVTDEIGGAGLLKMAILATMCCVPTFAFSQSSGVYPTLSHVVSESLVEDYGQTLGAAEAAKARPLVPIALELIEYFEKWIPYAYDDPSHYCTIGYGHLIALQPCDQIKLGEFATPLNEDKRRALLDSDTTTARLAVGHLVEVDLTDQEFSALSSFVFNVGKQNFEKSTILKLLNNGLRKEAAEQFGRWISSKGVVFAGLVSRRACEKALFLGQLEPDKTGHFNASACESLGVSPEGGPLIDIVLGERQ